MTERESKPATEEQMREWNLEGLRVLFEVRRDLALYLREMDKKEPK